MSFGLSSFYEDREFMCETKECKVCGQDYRTIDALGKLQCRYHPGLVEEDEQRVFRYSCCGQPLNPRHKDYYRLWKFGCTPADHTILERPYEQQDNLELLQRPDSLEHYKVLQFNPLTCRYIVWRYDFEQAEYRNQFGTYSREVATRLYQNRLSSLQTAMATAEEDSSDSEFALIESEDDDDTEWTDTEGDEEDDDKEIMEDDDDDMDNDHVLPLFV